MPAADAWVEYLASLERQLEALEALPPTDVRINEPFLTPTHLGPLPPVLAGRVREVLRRTEDNAARVAEAMTSTARSTRSVKAMNVRGPAPSSNFDFSF